MRKKILTVVALAGLLYSCSKDKDPESATGKMEVRMTDSPAQYEEVNIDVQSVEVHAGSDSTSGWVPLNVNKGIYNLLELTNGVDTLLGIAELPVGKISQVRLILGENNSIRTGGSTYPLETPSAQQSGLKLQVNAEIKADITYKLLLDFDAARSIVETGAGKYKLKPVIKVITEASGSIKGTINPAAAKPVVYAINGTDTSTAFADTSSGMFLIRGLSPATYSIQVKPLSPYKDTTFTASSTAGAVNDVGTVTLKQ
jgi:hypothetical protein